MKILLLILALSVSLVGKAQPAIKGIVSDGRRSLPGVALILLSADTVFMKGSMTDSTGGFVFDDVVQGGYLISASMIGYSKFVSAPISVNSRDVDVPEIILQEVATELDAVLVSGERRRFDQAPDRYVINLEGSITSSGNTILEVLQKSPGVVVNKQNNSIGMNGKSGVRVMINNKVMELPPDAMIQMLDGMSASNVERIEMITTPPARHDAEGNAGIIHILTKSNVDLGTRGSFGLTLGAKWAETVGGNFNLNHRKSKIGYFLDYAATRTRNLHLLKMNWQFRNGDFHKTVSNVSHRENTTLQQNLNAGFEWKPAENTLLNFLFTGYKRDWKLNAFTNDVNRITSDSTVFSDMQIVESNIWQSATGSISLQTKVDKRSDMSFTADYLYYNNDNPSRYDNNLFFEQAGVNAVSQIGLGKKTPIQFFVGRADYQHQTSPSLKWESGLKIVASTLNNDVVVQRGENNVWTTDTVFTSYSSLSERMYAGYISGIWRMRKWQINGGLRYEYTLTRIADRTVENSLSRRFGYLFPVFSFRKTLDIEKDFQLSYSRRITRPTYNDIAPFVFFWGPNTFSAGNTALYPAIADAVTVGYHNREWNVSLQYSRVRNEITFLQPEVDVESNNLIYRSRNLEHLKTLGMTNSYAVMPALWWELQGSVTAQYQAARTSHLSNNVKIELYSLNVNLVGVLKMPRAYSIEVSGMFQSRSLSGISQYLPFGSLNAGIQKTFGENGTIRLSMDDILYTNYWRIRTCLPDNDLDSYFNYNWHNQFIRMTYSRSFGNNKLRALKLKSGSEEERGRVGN